MVSRKPSGDKQARKDNPYVVVISLLVFLAMIYIDSFDGTKQTIDPLLYYLVGSVFAGSALRQVLNK